MRTAIRYTRRIPNASMWDIDSAGPNHRVDDRAGGATTVCGRAIQREKGWEILPRDTGVGCINCIKKMKRDE